MYPNTDNINWHQQYQKIMALPPRELKEQTAQIIGKFPDTFHYSKRMVEELFISANKDKNLPLVILRPSVIATSAIEPLPGWTDTTGLI